jgi:hypothetical protein
VNASRKRIQTLRKLSEMNANEFVTETGNVIEKETVIVSAGVAVPGRGTENVIVETETERGIGGTENVIEEKGTRRSAEIVSLSVQKRKKLESSKNLQMTILIMLQQTMRKETMKMLQLNMNKMMIDTEMERRRMKLMPEITIMSMRQRIIERTVIQRYFRVQ